MPNPTYKQVCGGDTGHAEAIRIGYDPEQLALGDLLDIFFATHDPTQLNRQGNDVGTQYRSAVFPADEAQEAEMRAAIERAQAGLDKPIVTTVEPMADWYPAEDYHQDYWETSGRSNPYCMAVIRRSCRSCARALPRGRRRWRNLSANSSPAHAGEGTAPRRGWWRGSPMRHRLRRPLHHSPSASGPPPRRAGRNF